MFRRRCAGDAPRRPGRPAEDPGHELLARADHAEAALEELLSVVSHDLCNPLSVVLIGVRLLERKVPTDAPERRAVDAIARGADEINRLVQDLVDARRIEVGTFAVEVAPTDVRAILDHAIGRARPAAAQRKVTLLRDDVAGPQRVAADADAIERALSTVIADAIRLSPTGAEVTVRAEPDGELVRFSVDDEGPGLDEGARFEAFRRPMGARARSRQGGSVSAFVARGIVEAHGGRVWVERAPRGGCSVRFTVPRA